MIFLMETLNYRVQGDKLLVQLIPAPDEDYDDYEGVIVDHFTVKETDGGKLISVLDDSVEKQFLQKGIVLQIGKHCEKFIEDQYPDLKVGCIAHLSKHAINNNHHFFGDKKAGPQTFNGLLLIPIHYIEAIDN